jgi:Mg-chelatase subunit ChlI
MKLALILNVIDPKIGGVMIMGDRGTGKSTTIRALADLLPEMPVIASEWLPPAARLGARLVQQHLELGQRHAAAWRAGHLFGARMCNQV